MEPLGWQRRAACLDLPTEQFFPRPREPLEAPEWLTRLCGGCPVRQPCLALALRTNSRGLFAGTTTSERRRLATG